VVALLPFAAGNFIYIAASDLIPEIKARRGAGRGILHVGAFILGAALLYLLAGGGVSDG
jgi:zinc and cadmium transporter